MGMGSYYSSGVPVARKVCSKPNHPLSHKQRNGDPFWEALFRTTDSRTIPFEPTQVASLRNRQIQRTFVSKSKTESIWPIWVAKVEMTEPAHRPCWAAHHKHNHLQIFSQEFDHQVRSLPMGNSDQMLIANTFGFLGLQSSNHTHRISTPKVSADRTWELAWISMLWMTLSQKEQGIPHKQCPFRGMYATIHSKMFKIKTRIFFRTPLHWELHWICKVAAVIPFGILSKLHSDRGQVVLGLLRQHHQSDNLYSRLFLGVRVRGSITSQNCARTKRQKKVLAGNPLTKIISLSND